MSCSEYTSNCLAQFPPTELAIAALLAFIWKWCLVSTYRAFFVRAGAVQAAGVSPIADNAPRNANTLPSCLHR